MHGNMWEWCWDWYGSYPTQPTTDPKGPDSGTDKVTRGGASQHAARYCRSAMRGHSAPSYKNNNLGFRMVRYNCPP
ncbi:MAG: SUMF1/EgtB/PvdO family nonheme iron enzyme [bacterium]